MDNLKNLLKSTKGKIIMGVGLVIVLVLVFVRKRGGDNESISSSGFAGYGSGGSSGGSGGSSGSGASALELAQMADSMNKGMISLQQNFDKRLQDQQTTNSNLLTGIIGSFGYMEDQYKSEIAGLRFDLNSQLSELANQRMLSQIVTPISYSFGTVTTNDDYTVYGRENPYPVAGQTALQTGSMPAYGYGGIDYNSASQAQKQQIAANQKAISTDESYRQSEIQRTQQVIANRQAAGLDTSAQQKYLNVNLKAG